MAEPLKNYYNRSYFSKLCADIRSQYPDFATEKFMALLFDDAWESRELKERMHHTARCIHDALGEWPYRDKLSLLRKVAPLTSKNSAHNSFLDMFFPDFVEQYGMDDWETSLDALEFFTQFSSSEFAVRPFITRYPHETMKKLIQWSTHENHHVRRLASEGCRPRLPWGMALPQFKQDPSPILPVLEKLKQDNSEYVRKSVANNLNDISKDHPQLVLEIARQWYGTHQHTDRLIKHACRTLLKAGNQDALGVFGYADNAAVKATAFTLNRSSLCKGETLSFSSRLEVMKKSNLRLEYKIQYARLNGKSSHKVFKISEKECNTGTIELTRKHSFADLSTRRHYPGTHHIALLVNGKELASAGFELEE